MQKSIFLRNDIRGEFQKEITLKNVEIIGKSIGQFFKKGEVVVGFDARKNSPRVLKYLTKGLTSQGINVINIGLCSTPMIYFASIFLKTTGSIMITASHNPPEFTGFKINKENAIPIGDNSGLREIEKIFLNNDFNNKKIKKGKVKKENIWKEYRKFVLSFLKIKKIVKIVVDGGNSTPSIDIERIFKGTKVRPIIINKKIIHSKILTSNPLIDSNLEIQKIIKNKKVLLGACFDFDGDRIFFIDEKGKKLPSYVAGGVLAENTFNCDDLIVCDNRFDRGFDEKITSRGNKIIISQVGHTKIKSKMKKNNASFGLEFSGHYYFKDTFYTDSGIITLVKMISAIEKTKKAFSKLARKYNKYYSTNETNFEINEKEKAISLVSKAFLGGRRNMIDGLRVDYPDWWFIIRPSQTQSLLRLIVGGKNKKIVKKNEKEIIEIIKSVE
jgi:phosphomannomutase